ncbi:MAG: hypothetical protein NTU53_00855 [Planctomycetota bacterium]|nr:hypothetical protein [Planctomycetota bacterium]
MTEKQIAGLAPALRSYLHDYEDHLGGGAVREHVDTAHSVA